MRTSSPNEKTKQKHSRYLKEKRQQLPIGLLTAKKKWILLYDHHIHNGHDAASESASAKDRNTVVSTWRNACHRMEGKHFSNWVLWKQLPQSFLNSQTEPWMSTFPNSHIVRERQHGYCNPLISLIYSLKEIPECVIKDSYTHMYV